MQTLGIELSDAGFVTAICETGEPRLLEVLDGTGSPEWPGFCLSDGTNLKFGRAAEDMWLVHPRRVVHNFWARLAHEPSTISLNGKPLSFSELAFFYFREFNQRLAAATREPAQMVLTLPGSYLKDPSSEEEKIGLLLGMAGELKLPLAGFIDMACAALCDPRAPGFNHALPVVVVDLGLDGAELTLFTTGDTLARRSFLHLPQLGLSHLLKHLTGTMGNRFLRHTAFDILEDGRIEQTFFRQTKDFVFSDAPEYRFLINTASRAYEMLAKRDQIGADSHVFVATLVQAVQSFLQHSSFASDPCTVALTDRAAHLPGLETRLRAAGFVRLLRLPRGAAACGAARIGASRLKVPADLADVTLECSVPIADTRSLKAAPWEVRLKKQHGHVSPMNPTHAIIGGRGRPLGPRPRFTIGPAEKGADLPLPATFGSGSDCLVALVLEDGRWWFTDPVPARDADPAASVPTRAIVDSGDLLIVRCGEQFAEILFAHCPAARRD